MRNYFINRRGFLWSAGLAVTVSKSLFDTKHWSSAPGADQEFLIVNGWVLTREDFAASEVMHDVV